jgi:hypothetical protein
MSALALRRAMWRGVQLSSSLSLTLGIGGSGGGRMGSGGAPFAPPPPPSSSSCGSDAGGGGGGIGGLSSFSTVSRSPDSAAL